MHGNLSEWCQDWNDSDYYEESSANVDPEGADNGSGRVYRGGNWIDFPQHCRSAARCGASPRLRFDNVGFRVAVDPADE